MKGTHHFKIDKKDMGIRIDIFLSSHIKDMSRSNLQKGIRSGWVKVNDQMTKSNYRLKTGDLVLVDPPTPRKQSPEPEDLPLDMVYEDEDILAVNKTRGMVVYPAPGNDSGTLVNGLLHYTADLSRIGGPGRPGIIHRLDKDTSGIILVAKNDFSHQRISRQFKKREVLKTYLTLVRGRVQDQRATINAPIGRHPVRRQEMTVTDINSRDAITHFTVLERFSGYTFLKVQIETGRTHQIRVHMRYIGHPIVGDRVYNRGKRLFKIQGQALHAHKLGFKHPRLGDYMELEAPLPQDLSSILEILRKREG